MTLYRHILVAVELEDASRQVLARAKGLADALGARLSVLHVLEITPVHPATVGDLDLPMMPPVDLSEPMTQNALRRILPWCAELGIPEEAVEVVFDSIKEGIAEFAERAACDLIVVGHHSHRGLSSLFSHTENRVLSRARCDVMAVALDDSARP